jgi:dUTP pyrophosphatase
MAAKVIADVQISVVRVGKIEAPLPRYQTSGSAGMDLHAALEQKVVIAPGARAKIPTGLAFAIPVQFEAQVRPRSGLAAKHGVTVLNAPGTIDSDYRGEVQVVLVNHGDAEFVVAPMDRIAQLVIAPVARAELVVVASLDETDRGEGGYGSTG